MSDLDELARLTYARPSPPPRRGTPPGIIVGALLIAAGLGGAVWFAASRSQVVAPAARPIAPPRAAPSGIDPETRQKLRNDLGEMMRTGVVHSVDYERGRMRISTAGWLSLKIEQKEQLVKALSMASTPPETRPMRSVQILSDRNDTVFAEYDPWNGVQVHH